MAKVVEAHNSVDAWKSAVAHLLSNGGEDFNLIVCIDNPCFVDPEWFATYNPAGVAQGADKIRSVVSTVFPKNVHNFSRDRHHFYQRYSRGKALAPHVRRAMGAGPVGWGTYFDRLINFGVTSTNQLETAIQKLREWPRVSKAALVLHLSSPETDKPRTRGGPCWHYGEICGRSPDVCDFTVVYRNHDYFNKALGNFIALGYLLEFICHESGKTPGRLVCHSVHADFGGQSHQRMRRLAQLECEQRAVAQ